MLAGMSNSMAGTCGRADRELSSLTAFLDEPQPAPAAAVNKAGKSPQPLVSVFAWAGQHDAVEPASSLFTNAPGAAGGRAIAANTPPKKKATKWAAGAATEIASGPDVTSGACTPPTASGRAKKPVSAMAEHSPIAARATGSKPAASSRPSGVAPGREWRSSADATAACSEPGPAGAGAAPARSPARRLLDALRWLGGGKHRDLATAGAEVMSYEPTSLHAKAKRTHTFGAWFARRRRPGFKAAHNALALSPQALGEGERGASILDTNILLPATARHQMAFKAATRTAR